MTRLLALATGATCGYLVGWLAGSNVARMAEVHRLARPGVPVRPVEQRIAPGGTETRPDAEAALRSEIPAQRDDEPCTQRSPGGGLVCCRKGTHAGHLFEGAHARDRKDDTDEGIE